MSDKYSYKEAKVALNGLLISKNPSMNQVRDIISRIDAGSGEKKTTVLYTGKYDDIGAYRAAEDFAVQFSGQTHALRDTDVGKFIAQEGKLLKKVVGKAEGLDYRFQENIDKFDDPLTSS